MLDLYKSLVVNQFEAALAMLKKCVVACPQEHWEGKIANDTFRYVAYHTLFFADLYLSPSEQAFELRDLHQRGGDERGEEASMGLSREDTLEYIELVYKKLREALTAETEQTLAGPSGITRRKYSRAELHIYNLRHVQHHTGAMYAYLRRVVSDLGENTSLPWISSGWR
jgi:uncharacterized damage-inducible protein DinB